MPEKIRILIVEDEADLALNVRIQIQSQGYEPVVVGSVKESIACLLERPPALILLDIQLPDGSGFQILERVKGDDVMRNIPVIILSGFGGKSYVEKGLGAGASDYFVKPHEPEALFERISELLPA